MTAYSLTFICFKRDEPFEIQLEPEAILFKVMPGNEIVFKGIPLGKVPFEWAVSMDHKNQATQLFPKGWPYEIEIFENGVLLEDWYKYM